MSAKNPAGLSQKLKDKLKDKVQSKLAEAKDDSKPKSTKSKEKSKERSKDKSKHKSKDKAEKAPKKDSFADEDIEKGMSLLGGSKEDLDLIQGISDSEEEVLGLDTKSVDKKLSNEVDNFMKDLGLADFRLVDEFDEASSQDVSEVKDHQESKNAKEEDTKAKPSKAEKKKLREEKRLKDKEEKKNKKKEQKDDSAADKTLPAMDEFTIKKPNLSSNGNAKGSSSSLLLDNSKDWHSQDLKQSETTTNTKPLSDREFEEIYDRAKAQLRNNENYVHEDSRSTSQKKFMSELLTAGTLSDKISALTLLAQESPQNSVKHIESLLGLCRKKSKGSALQAVAALKDLLINSLLPDRKLKYFKAQPVARSTAPEMLLEWAYDDWLKNLYFEFLQILETLSHDPVAYIRSNTVTHIVELLKAKPEQEVNLLRLAVNKLGDLDKKVASRTSYLLLQLEQAHPAMKGVIINSIAELMFRPGTDYHARYYSVITLNQTILAHKDTEVANTLVKSYFMLFERLLVEWDKQKPLPKGKSDESQLAAKPKKPRWKNKGNKGKHGGERQMAKTSEEVVEEQASKLMSAILTGLNRAYPFSRLPSDIFEQHLDTLYRATHSSNFNTSIQALVLLYQISRKEKHVSDRYYKAIYASLQDPKLASSSNLRMYLNLLFKSLRDDVAENPARVIAFVKRILQMSSHWLNNGVVSGVLYLIFQLTQSNTALKKAFFDPDYVLEDPKEEDKEYDGRARDPRFAHAGKSKLWELITFLRHFHPTIEHYATGITGETDAAEIARPDLDLHTLAHFLDRFAYRNPKKSVGPKGDSIMQPLAAADPRASIVAGGGATTREPMNTYDWSKVDLSKINVEDKFFYHYFSNRAPTVSKKKSKGSDFDDDDQEIDEDEVWGAIVKSNPDVEGDDDSDDFSDEDIDMDSEDFSDDESDEDKNADADSDSPDDFDNELDDELMRELEQEIGTGNLSDDSEENDSESDSEEEGDSEGEGKEDLNVSADLSGSDEDDVSEDEELADSDGAESSDGDNDKALTGLDDDDLLDSDEEVAESTAVPVSSAKSLKRSAKEHEGKSKRRKLKELPLFASAEDYAEYLQSDDDKE